MLAAATALALACVPICTPESAGHQAQLATNEFAASCINLDAEPIETAAVCIGGLDGSVDVVYEGISPGHRVALSPQRDRIAAITSDGIVVVSTDGTRIEAIALADATALAWRSPNQLYAERRDGEGWSVVALDLGQRGKVEEVASGPGADDDSGGLASSPDGTELLLVVADGDEWVLSALDPTTGAMTDVRRSHAGISMPDVSPDGRLVAVVIGAQIEVLELVTGAIIDTVERPNPVTSPTFSPDGTHLLYLEARGALELQSVGDPDSTAVVYDIDRHDDPRATFPTGLAWS